MKNSMPVSLDLVFLNEAFQRRSWFDLANFFSFDDELLGDFDSSDDESKWWDLPSSSYFVFSGTVSKNDSLSYPLAEPLSDPLPNPLSNPVAEPLSDPLAEPLSDPLAKPLSNLDAVFFLDILAEPLSDPLAVRFK